MKVLIKSLQIRTNILSIILCVVAIVTPGVDIHRARGKEIPTTSIISIVTFGLKVIVHFWEVYSIISAYNSKRADRARAFAANNLDQPLTKRDYLDIAFSDVL